jgi:hypothetical protein
MLVSAVLAGTTDSKLALYLRMDINTFLTIRASWEILALLGWVNKRTIFWFQTIWKMLAFY